MIPCRDLLEALILLHQRFFQNTDPNHYKIKVIYEDDSVDLFEEDEDVVVNNGITKKGKKITALDI